MTTRSKRWNGKFENLSADFLRAVLEKMNDYGDRVQFSLTGGSAEPSYQVINPQDKRIAFDNRHTLFKSEGDDFTGANATGVYTADQVKAAIAGFAPASSGGRTVKAARAGGTRISAARLEEQYATARYEYYRNNRQTLPPGITGHTEEITGLMKQGKSVEEAFDEVLRKYF